MRSGVRRTSWPARRPRRLGPDGVQGGQQGAQETGEAGAVALGKVLEESMLGLEQGGEGVVDGGATLGREPDDHATPVIGIGVALDESASAETVDPVRHGAAGDQGLVQQAPRRELVRRARAAQRGQHVELPLLDPVGGERVAPGELQAPGQPADAAEHRDRREVELVPLAAPGLEQLVHLVPHASTLKAVENLDIKMYSLHTDTYLDVKRSRGWPVPHTWDPDRYLAYADERGRPFVELVARVGVEAPGTVVDLGCGPGNLTALLRQRWPDAAIRGLDSSPEMIEKARAVD